MKTIKMIENGFTPRQVLVLELLKKEEKTASEMASNLLSKVSITAIIDDLSKRKLVKRKRSKKDRRKILLSITEEGKAILKK
jgi:MarR family transcriptional regulator, negative regulator of the multidrug operon emrRAB